MIKSFRVWFGEGTDAKKITKRDLADIIVEGLKKFKHSNLGFNVIDLKEVKNGKSRGKAKKN